MKLAGALVVLLMSSTAAPAQEAALGVACEPSHPFFCMNIHAGCAGRTETATFPFKLKADAGRGWIESSDADMRELYANGRAEWEDGETRVIVRPQRAQGYIRLLADGKYVFRYYRGASGIMSYGQCR